MMDLVIISVTLLLFIYSGFLVAVLIGIRKVKNSTLSEVEFPTVTILIPFRNESSNIEKSAISISQLDYPKEKLEIIYINDHSTDNSVEKLSKYISDNIKLIDNDVVDSGFKKAAITKAVGITESEVIVLTDADCIHHKLWLKRMMKCFDKQTGMVVGPVIFGNGKSLFNKFQQLEFAGLMLTAAGLIGIKNPKICSSANLAFTKKIFLEVNGYNDNDHLSSGDDELLMQKIYYSTNSSIQFCWDEVALVRTDSNPNLQEFLQQRRRWASKSFFYKSKVFIVLLTSIFLLYLALIVLPIMSLFNGNYFSLVGVSFIMKFSIEYLIIREGKDFLFDGENMRYFIIAQLIQIPYIVVSSLLGVFGNYSWKNRKVKR